jgi:hypothetical protein
MAVDTKKVHGRRRMRFNSIDELWAEAETLAAAPQVACLGNWSVGQTLKHLGVAMEGSINGPGFKVPLMLRIIGRIYVKRLLLNGPFPSGFQLPGAAAKRLVAADSTTPAEGLAALRHGIARLQSETTRTAHPVAGRLSINEWNRFHLRHAEMHLSFLVPGQAPSPRGASAEAVL